MIEPSDRGPPESKHMAGIAHINWHASPRLVSWSLTTIRGVPVLVGKTWFGRKELGHDDWTWFETKVETDCCQTGDLTRLERWWMWWWTSDGWFRILGWLDRENWLGRIGTKAATPNACIHVWATGLIQRQWHLLWLSGRLWEVRVESWTRHGGLPGRMWGLEVMRATDLRWFKSSPCRNGEFFVCGRH